MGKSAIVLLAFCILAFVATSLAQGDIAGMNFDPDQLKDIMGKLNTQGLGGVGGGGDHDDHDGHDHDDHEGHNHGEPEPAAPSPVKKVPRGPSGVTYVPPQPSGPVVFFESFDSNWASRWNIIESERYNGNSYNFKPILK